MIPRGAAQSISRWRQPQLTGLILVNVLAASLLAMARGYLNLQFVGLMAVGLIALPFIARDAMATYYAGVPILILFANLGIRIPFPLFSSPVDFLVTAGVGLGILRLVVQRERLPSSAIYYPIGLFVIVAATQTFVIQPDNSFYQVAFEKVIRGMWPFYLIVLSLRTPRQAQYVLVILLGTLFAATIVRFPGVLHVALTGQQTLLRAKGAVDTGNAVADFSLNLGLRSYLFIVPFATLIAFPISFFILLSKYKTISLTCMAFIIIFVLLSSIASGLVATAISAAITFILLSRSVANPATAPGERSSLHALLSFSLAIIAFLLVTQYLVESVPVAHEVLERVQNPQSDASGSARIKDMELSTQAFLSSPLFGGASIGGRLWHGGHESIVSFAANWGLIFSLPYFMSLTVGIANLFWLLGQRHNEIEQAILIAMIACVAGNVVVSFATPNIFELFADLLIWTFIGLSIVWRNWVKTNPNASLF